MTRAVEYPALFANLASYQAIERDWHLSVAAALLENWEIAERSCRRCVIPRISRASRAAR